MVTAEGENSFWYESAFNTVLRPVHIRQPFINMRASYSEQKGQLDLYNFYQMHSLPMSSIALHNSAYLSNDTVMRQAFMRTQQQILPEEPPSSFIKINQSSRKIEMESDLYESKYHPKQFEISNSIIKDMWNNTVRQKPQYREMDDQPERRPPTQRKPIFKVFQQSLAKWVGQVEQQEKQINESWIKKRDKMAARAEHRRQERIKQRQMQLQEKRRLQKEEENESDIEQENRYAEDQVRQQKVRNFISRQQFAVKERQILRQMREFCLYGSIKLDNKTKVFQ